MIRYRIPPGVSPTVIDRQIFLTTLEGGRVWIDRRVLELWQSADGLTPKDILEKNRQPAATHLQILVGLACLAEAGLLDREGSPTELPAKSVSEIEPVSIIIVSFNSRQWLDDCLDSIKAQSCTPLETILVDNASQDGTAGEITKSYPDVSVIPLDELVPLSSAINIGIQAANGKYLLLLNPDVVLEQGAIAEMLKRLKEGDACAAVAPKLRLLRAPAFLNGLGNLVGSSGWGTDLGLGHLDLGQFDHWNDLPSACFAATLIPASAIQAVGLLDDGFIMYYEDSEWSYRARMLGYRVLSAPNAIVYHAFSGQMPGLKEPALTPTKLRRTTYGRLRFISRINAGFFYWRFLICYLFEDSLRLLGYLIRLQPQMSFSVCLGLLDYYRSLKSLLPERAELQMRRIISDQELYHVQKKAPVPLIHAGAPLLTWDVITNEYLPSILSGQTHQFPELENDGGLRQDESGADSSLSGWARWSEILRTQGLMPMLRQAARRIQWRLSLP